MEAVSPRVSLALCLELEAESQDLAVPSLKNRTEEALDSTDRIPPLYMSEARGSVCLLHCTLSRHLVLVPQEHCRNHHVPKDQALSLNWGVWAAFDHQ